MYLETRKRRNAINVTVISEGVDGGGGDGDRCLQTSQAALQPAFERGQVCRRYKFSELFHLAVDVFQVVV